MVQWRLKFVCRRPSNKTPSWHVKTILDFNATHITLQAVAKFRRRATRQLFIRTAFEKWFFHWCVTLCIAYCSLVDVGVAFFCLESRIWICKAFHSSDRSIFDYFSLPNLIPSVRRNVKFEDFVALVGYFDQTTKEENLVVVKVKSVTTSRTWNWTTLID